jgi:hypothetical protein
MYNLSRSDVCVLALIRDLEGRPVLGLGLAPIIDARRGDVGVSEPGQRGSVVLFSTGSETRLALASAAPS